MPSVMDYTHCSTLGSSIEEEKKQNKLFVPLTKFYSFTI